MSNNQTDLAFIQANQQTVYRMRDQFKAYSLPWWGLHVLWEAHRVAWYAVRGDWSDAASKLDLLESAIADLRSVIQNRINR